MGKAGKALYLVLSSQGTWWVDYEGRASGPYSSRESAALEARTLARMQVPIGREAQVLVPDADGKFWVIWSSLYDHDDAGQRFVPHRVTDD
jgi:hypothetical protein